LILSASEGTLLRLYEGYWGSRRPGSWLAAAGKNWHKRQRRLKKNDYEFIYRNYPRDRNLNAPAGVERPEYIMPTRLGNIFKAAELYPGDEGRYGMDTVFFWPRLYQVIPDNALSSLDDARTSLALMLNVCTLALGLAVGTLIALAVTTIMPAAAYWAVAAGGAVVAWLAYRSALSSATVYGDLVRSMYDLYRGDLLAKLGFALPDTMAGERELWKNLGKQMYRRAPDSQSVLDDARAKAVSQAAGTAAPAENSATIKVSDSCGARSKHTPGLDHAGKAHCEPPGHPAYVLLPPRWLLRLLRLHSSPLPDCSRHKYDAHSDTHRQQTTAGKIDESES